MENPLLRNAKKKKKCNLKGTTMVQAVASTSKVGKKSTIMNVTFNAFEL